MSLHLISTTLNFPCDFSNNLIQYIVLYLSKGARIDNSALKVLKLAIYLEKRVLSKLNPLDNAWCFHLNKTNYCLLIKDYIND